MSASILLRMALTVALCVAAAAAEAQQKIGVVLMHGKLGVPLGVSDKNGPGVGAQLIEALKGAGYLVAAPEMCWSRRRGFDKPRDQCLAEIDQAIAGLKAQGATAIVVGGQSLGGHAALSYGASHAGLLGVIGLAPADDAQRKARRPDIAAAVARAQQLVASGQGDTREMFADTNTGPQGTFSTVANTTARIYLSFFDPGNAPIAQDVAALKAPLLWIAGTEDPTQRDSETAYFQHAPANPLNRYVTVEAAHLATPDAACDAVVAWLKDLAKR